MDKMPMPIPTIVSIAGGVGSLVGLGYAFSQKKGFWGYVGFFVLGSLVGSLIGTVGHQIYKTASKKK